MKQTITTVIPTYRRPELLRRAILSVLSQTWRDLQVNVFDDASGDETANVVAQLARRDSRVHYIRHSANLGMMPNTAYAVAQVCTPFFTILNDDDFLAPDFFMTAMESFERWPSAGVFVGRLLYWDIEIPERTRSYFTCTREELVSAPNAAVRIMATDQNHTWTSMVFRREVLTELGGVDDEIGFLADLEFELRVLAHYPTIMSPQACAVYYLSPQSSSYRDYLTRYLPGARRILAKFRTDNTLTPNDRRRLVGALEGHFRRAAKVGAARSLTLEDLEPARRAAAFLESEFGSPLAASAIRLAANGNALGRGSRALLRRVKLIRRRLRRDPGVDETLAYVEQVLARLSPRTA